jgi:hypothetical protein
MFAQKVPRIWSDGGDRDHLAVAARVLVGQGWLGGKRDPFCAVIAEKPADYPD